MFKAKVKMPNTKLFDLSEGTRAIKQEAIKAMNRAVAVIESNVISEAPVGATGDLRSSINSNVKSTGQSVIGIVFAGKRYAMPVNDGRKASPVSATGQLSIKRWVEKSSGGRALWSSLRAKYPKITSKQVAFLVARKKKQKATKGQKFFDKGFELSVSEINRIFKQFNIRVAEKLS